jgi:carbon starvation protein
LATLIFLPLVCLAIWYGKSIPLFFPSVFGLTPAQLWNYALLFYCFAASIIPVWLLLQPRGYLGGFFLYAVLAAGLAGLYFGGEKIAYPAFTGWTNANGLPLFPLLFVTVACGACSGFHGIVCSGTTSKQIEKETDCRAVGYGGMLLEGLVAVLALSTVMILAKGNPLLNQGPDRIYAEGLSVFVQHLGIPRDFARSFTLLAFTTFIYDTLDVATRLARHIFQELTGWKGRRGVVLATLASLAIPFFCVSLKVTDGAGHLIPVWKVFWTLFGTSNQLLAALTLMMLSVWLYKSGKPWWISVVPMVFMMLMTLWSLGLMISPFVSKLLQGHFVVDAVLVTALLLCALALLLIKEAIAAVLLGPSTRSSGASV